MLWQVDAAGMAGYSSISILVNTCVEAANDAQCLFVCSFVL